ncbi:MAG: tRNA pseudouridine(55) synthase TruB [Acidimicrobiia bacterium]
MAEGPDGFAVVDKAAGWTSHDVVAKARGILGTKRVGHAGTLDPGATGVLLLGVGRATRLLRFVGDLPKRYVGEVVLGTETTTLDDEGEVTAIHDMTAVTLEAVRAAAVRFVGDIEQVPPMVSALKVGGRRLHELARAGIEVERRPRPVTVHSLEVTGPVDDPGAPVFRIEVECSSGTYVRTLAADLGSALGGGAHLRRLRRTAIGPHTLAGARPLDDLVLLPMAAAVGHLARVAVDRDGAELVATGRLPPLDLEGDGPWSVMGPDGELLAVAERVGDRVKPGIVLAAR